VAVARYHPYEPSYRATQHDAVLQTDPNGLASAAAVSEMRQRRARGSRQVDAPPHTGRRVVSLRQVRLSVHAAALRL